MRTWTKARERDRKAGVSYYTHTHRPLHPANQLKTTTYSYQYRFAYRLTNINSSTVVITVKVRTACKCVVIFETGVFVRCYEVFVFFRHVFVLDVTTSFFFAFNLHLYCIFLPVSPALASITIWLA